MNRLSLSVITSLVVPALFAADAKVPQTAAEILTVPSRAAW